MIYSSEGLKPKVYPNKLLSEMSDKELFEFRNTLNVDSMGFNGTEGTPIVDDEDDKIIASAINSTSCIIQDNLTTINYSNGSLSRIKFIVIHYTGNNGDTAKGNTNFFKSEYRGSSAHYFVDEGNIIWRCVEDKNISWHCGGKIQSSNGHTYYKICTNSNSIGIELCSRKYNDGTYYFKEETINNCIYLVKYLMNKYNIPIENVIRHYDVTGKTCPEPFVRNTSQWTAFKNKLILNETTHWARNYLNTLISKGVITDENQWSAFDSPVNKALAIALIDKVSGGIWKSDEANSSIHWCQPHIISLCGKKIIHDKDQWLNSLDNNISKALLLSLICNMTGGLSNLYANRVTDHWARNCLDTLCDRGIINTPASWTDFEAEVNKGQTMALICKTLYK